MSRLHIADGFSLPIDAVTQRISILGKTRSGKSHTAGVIVEEVLKARQQVVILDPKGDWYGLRSSADGKSAGLSITIMGGKHGDIPLEPTAGAIIADVVVEGTSLVLDLSLFDSKADEIRFATAFLDRLYRKNTEPVLLVVDEADVFAPQKPEKNETTMLNRMETICRRGAGRGIGVVLISQRSAALHKGCLSQTELMIAHQTTAPQDKDAIKEWVVDHGDEEQRENFLTRIPKLKTGTAITWSPSWLEIYEEVTIRRKETYDSGDAPKVGQRRRAPKVLAQVDLERLKKHMSETIEKAKQEDPVALREEIRRLKTDLARAAGASRAAPKAPAAPGIVKTVERIVKVPILITRDWLRLEKGLRRMEKALNRWKPTHAPLVHKFGEREASLKEKKGIAARSAPPLAPPMKSDRTQGPSSGHQNLDKCSQAILAVLGQYPEGCLIGKLALLSGYRQSGGFKNSLAILRGKGYIVGGNGATMSITEDGVSAVGEVRPLPQGRELARYWLSHSSFGTCERKILESLLEGPQEGLTIEELCGQTGYNSPPSGGFKNSLSILRTAGVLVGRNGERMKLDTVLYE